MGLPTGRAEIPIIAISSTGAVGGHDLSEIAFFDHAVHAAIWLPPSWRLPVLARNPMENIMPTFIVSLNWTDQGIRAIKDGAKRAKAAREMAKKFGVEIKEVYLTSGDSDLLAILDTPHGDNVAKFALALSAGGNVRTRTCRAWPQAEYLKLIAELP
jgi:uncharacterized protein with GYD domain